MILIPCLTGRGPPAAPWDKYHVPLSPCLRLSSRKPRSGEAWRMQLSPLPDLSSNRRLAWTALAVTLAVAGVLIWRDNSVATTLGDTDDAMRLVLVRDLLHGRGWWDQWNGRLQPPLGTYMHWSRLVDGALAGLIWLFERVMSPQAAEYSVRLLWPLAWILPAAACGLAIARSLGGKSAVFVGAVMLATNIQLYVQFRPGRIDHHDLQITMAVIAAACSMARGRRTRWAVLAGAAAGLGLAVGIEALAFQAIIGASYGLRFLLDDEEAKPATAYGLSLAGFATLFYAIQTPPWRWSMAFCDSLAWNLLAGLIVGGLGLAAVATWAAKSSFRVRLGLLAAVGVAAAATFLIIDPACIHGPFGAVDPRVRPFWFDRVQELQPWSRLLVTDRNSAVRVILMTLMALASAGYLVFRRRPWLQSTNLTIAALILLAAWAAAHAYRMQDYVYWFGVPALAATIGLLGERLLKGLMLPVLLASLVLSPICAAVVVIGLMNLIPAKAGARTPSDERCYEDATYQTLARLPPGLVLGEIDLGPFILADTRDSVLSAPYHRMSWGILAAHNAQAATSADAEQQVRALKIDYVVECPINPLRVPSASFEGDLRRGVVPTWLQKVSGPKELLQIYQVVPAKAGG